MTRRELTASTTNFEAALVKAREYAREGPRVAAILLDTADPVTGYGAVPGFVDNAVVASRSGVKGEWRQVCLVTPDGSVWVLSTDPADATRRRKQQ